MTIETWLCVSETGSKAKYVTTVGLNEITLNMCITGNKIYLVNEFMHAYKGVHKWSEDLYWINLEILSVRKYISNLEPSLINYQEHNNGITKNITMALQKFSTKSPFNPLLQFKTVLRQNEYFLQHDRTLHTMKKA